MAVQSEPRLAGLWLGGASLGARAGAERPLDLALGALGLALVLAAAWRAVGPSLPLLALAFLAYGRWGNLLPDGLLPHRGYSLDRLVGQTFLQGQGVYGVALYVMFAYVFLFLVLGTVLEATGATRWVLDLSRRLLGGAVGGPAKVAVVASGVMGSLSGSAVANTATTGVFTIPMMRGAGFSPAVAAGLEAAASSGGSADAAGDGRRGLHDAGDHRPAGQLPPDRAGGAPPRPALLPVALPDRPLPRPPAGRGRGRPGG